MIIESNGYYSPVVSAALEHLVEPLLSQSSNQQFALQTFFSSSYSEASCGDSLNSIPKSAGIYHFWHCTN